MTQTQTRRKPPTAAPMPTFAAPATRPLDPALPADHPDNLASQPLAGPVDDRTQELPALDDWPQRGRGLVDGLSAVTDRIRQTIRPTGDRTGTSATDDESAKLDPEKAARILAGVIGLVATGVSVFVAWRSKHTVTLRKPSREQALDIAEPVARILLRHFGLSAFPDIEDGVEALAAAGAYVSPESGPILVPVTLPTGEIPNQEGPDQ